MSYRVEIKVNNEKIITVIEEIEDLKKLLEDLEGKNENMELKLERIKK